MRPEGYSDGGKEPAKKSLDEKHLGRTRNRSTRTFSGRRPNIKVARGIAGNRIKRVFILAVSDRGEIK